jgi:hypothetical protein
MLVFSTTILFETQGLFEHNRHIAKGFHDILSSMQENTGVEWLKLTL